MKPRAARIILALLVLAVAIPALAQVTDDDVRRAKGELDRVMTEAQELGDRVQSAWARQLELEHEISGLEQSISHIRVLLTDAEDRLTEVGVEMYMSAASGMNIRMVVSASTGSYHAGLEYLRNVSGSDEELINRLHALRGELEHQTGRLVAASEEQAELTADLEVMAANLLEEVAAAQVYYDRMVEEKRRQEEEERRRIEEERRRAELAARATTTTAAPAATVTTARAAATTTAPAAATTTAPAAATTTAPAATTTSAGGEGTTTTTTTPPSSPTPAGGSCPVAGPVAFTDTWGAPRSGGRSHQGVDMIAARGTPIVAIYDGTIHRITTGVLSGLSVWLRSNGGDLFFYAHLDAYGEISVGQRVAEGYVIGFNGSSGNAPDWLPHLHFEYHPAGGGAVNPYPLVRSLC